MKRIGLFVATNLAVVFMLSITMRLLGVEPYLNNQGLNLNSLLVFAAVFGFGGAFISLAISKWSAKRAVGAEVITTPRTPMEQWLVKTVTAQAKVSGIKTPEVAIWDSPDVNAFATGMTKNSSLIAVSTGLLEQMSKSEAEAVLAHEMAHIANGDMVTLALVQGVVNTFVMFLSRVIGHTVDRVVFKSEHGHGPGFWVTMIVAELILGVFASIVVMWFSRQREFRADAGGAQLASRSTMIAALERLNALHPQPLPDKMAAFGVTGGPVTGFKRLFMTHPPLTERINALKAGAAI
ncbi:MAG: protease HtpX [Burkholderiaceae bacterium]